MPQFDPRTLTSISDEELLELELDKDLPIEEWMQVEKERGRREERRRRDAERAARAGDNGTPTRAASAVERREEPSIQEALQQLRALLVPGETMGAYAVQRRLFALTHRRLVVCATSGRFIALSRGLFGGYVPTDVRWQDLEDASISAGIFGATLTITSLATDDMASRGHVGRTLRITGLRKEQAQQVYTLCQAQEQAWREKRRVRELEELRAKSGGINLSGGVPGSGSAGAAGDSAQAPAARLQRAKEMREQGLLTDAEFEQVKARILSDL